MTTQPLKVLSNVASEPIVPKKLPVDPATLTHRELLRGPFWQKIPAYKGVDEATFRKRIYMAAVARCFPGKASGGGDRRPDAVEVEQCKTWLQREADILKPELVIAVGTLAIEQVLGVKLPLAEAVASNRKARWLGHEVDVVALPHPSGASPWHKMEPGKTLLAKGLKRLGRHPAMRRAILSS